jgi:hypothetical protein
VAEDIVGIVLVLVEVVVLEVVLVVVAVGTEGAGVVIPSKYAEWLLLKITMTINTKTTPKNL